MIFLYSEEALTQLANKVIDEVKKTIIPTDFKSIWKFLKNDKI